MAITAAMVKELRDMTGAGMMDCKKALNEHTEISIDQSSVTIKESINLYCFFTVYQTFYDTSHRCI